MKIKTSLLFTLLLALGNISIAQSLAGTWKGTSLCQVKNSPCHDEIVVYHISKDSTGKSYEVIANKIVDGKEDYMGTIPFTYDVKQNAFVSVDNVRNAKWEFKITGSTMKGTLMYKGDLYRVIDVKKEN